MHPSDGIRVLIVEDDAAYLRRFVDAVLGDPGLHFVAAVSAPPLARTLLDGGATDVMVVGMGEVVEAGVEMIRYARSRYPQTDALVVAARSDEACVRDCIGAGAAGYLLKSELDGGLGAGIHDLRRGGSPVSPSVARCLLACLRQRPAGAETARSAVLRASSVAGLLSQRERDILELVAKGMSFAEIGALLAISPHTVVAHLKKIYRKLAVHSRAEAVYEARQMGLL